jgi:dihydrolipoamide dehydrogenase
MSYDLIVIGGGPAGYLACERAGHAGLKTLLVEKEHLGGVCLNKGCVPTKTLLYSAKIADSASHGEKYGVIASDIVIDHAKVVKRKDGVVKKLVSGVRAAVKGSGVTIIDEKGIIKGKTDEGYEVVAADQSYFANRLLIATGSTPAVPPIPGLKEGLEAGFVLTNKEVLEITEVPKDFIVIGGGVIGLEMASYFNSAGSNVTVIEMLDKIGGMIDDDLAQILQKSYESKGVKFNLSCKVSEITKDGVVYEENGEVKTIKGDKVLLSIGRRANTADVGLENIGVATERGAILVDEQCKTNIPDVYAAGDVNGKSMLAHTAYREAEVAVNTMLGKKDVMRYAAIPSVIYTNPEIGGVGETESSAKEKGMDVTCKTITMNYSGRYMAENERGDGVCKIVVDNKWNKLVGVHMISNYASEIIVSAGIMIEKEMTIDEIKEIVFPHPTVSEVIREAIFQL